MADQWLVQHGLNGGESLIVDGFMRLALGARSRSWPRRQPPTASPTPSK
ncbi:MAG: hypothetical protein IPL05_04705 [Betaproteobacteria bacterium]|nr:hypothetical protein [Betaproteobacteria bacterium]